jgi:hypothetical protein
MAGVSRSRKFFTAKQGQYLAYIHLYTRLHRRPPAETDMQEYFRVSPPSDARTGGLHPEAAEDPPQHRTTR